LAGDLEADVAAHRQPGQGEAGWGVGQDAAGEGGDGVVVGGAGDRYRAVLPQGRELVGVQPWRGQQAGDEHDRERCGHLGASLLSDVHPRLGRMLRDLAVLLADGGRLPE
jgi:hypothetical protein